MGAEALLGMCAQVRLLGSSSCAQSRATPDHTTRHEAMRTLAQYFDAMRQSGDSITHFSIGSPMLVVRTVATRDEESLVFQTKFTSRMPLPTAALAGTDEAITPGNVLPVQKREGGAFPDRIGLGRAPNVDIRLPLAQVSKYHAFFACSEDVWTVTDAGSRNGTSVNDRLIDPKVSVRVENGWEVGIGPHRLAFYTPAGFQDLLRRRASVR